MAGMGGSSPRLVRLGEKKCACGIYFVSAVPRSGGVRRPLVGLVQVLHRFDRRDTLILHCYTRGTTKWKKALYSVMLVTIWCIWRRQNELVFQQKAICVSRVVNNIKSFGFLWIINRAKAGECRGTVEEFLK
ncbi:hypothetical protein Hanom_Chr13g01204071 [Helianthus anomalus]